MIVSRHKELQLIILTVVYIVLSQLWQDTKTLHGHWSHIILTLHSLNILVYTKWKQCDAVTLQDLNILGKKKQGKSSKFQGEI